MLLYLLILQYHQKSGCNKKAGPSATRHISVVCTTSRLAIPLKDTSLNIRAILPIDRRESFHRQPLKLMEWSVIHQICESRKYGKY